MPVIVDVLGREILDSRGNPTVEVEVQLEDGAFGRASVPSGASTGSREAVELRDGDRGRFMGRGVLSAVAAVNDVLGPEMVGLPAEDQGAVDRRLCDLDGSPNKGRLGANALLGVSLAVAHAAAAAANLPLFRYLGGPLARTLPVPLLNVINGGKHADNALDVQEVMLVPAGFTTFQDALRAGVEIYHRLKQLLLDRGLATGIGDEGGFAPNVAGTKQALDILVEAIGKAGYRPGEQVWLALDAAASEFAGQREGGVYRLEGRDLDAGALTAFYADIRDHYPLISLEDGLAEGDRQGWRALTGTLGQRLQLVGDDLFVTNIAILEEGIRDGLANAILIKPNQIGTLSETWAAVEMARRAGYRAIMSHRSGETDDVSIAHLAVATGCGQIKTGAPARGERVAKYNELLRIAERLGPSALFPGTAAFGSL